MNKRTCFYCFESIPKEYRKDALFCSVSCRVMFCKLQHKRRQIVVNTLMNNEQVSVSSCINNLNEANG